MSITSYVRPACFVEMEGTTSRRDRISAMSGVTPLCTAPTTTSWPRSLRRRPSSNMRNDLPTRGAYPRKILSRPRRSRRSSACTRRSNSSGLGLRSERGVTVSRIILAWDGRKKASVPSRSRLGLGLQCANRSRDREGAFAWTLRSMSQGGGRVQGQVELQDVHSGFAQDAHLTVLCMGGDQLADSLGGHPASGGHAGHLGIHGFGAQVRVQAAARGGYRIARDRAGERGILGAEGFHIGGYAVGEFLAGGAQVATARRQAIVAVVAGSRGAAVEVLGLGEALADQLRTHGAAIGLNQAAIRLVAEQDFGQAGDQQRIHDPREQGQNQGGFQCDEKLFHIRESFMRGAADQSA